MKPSLWGAALVSNSAASALGDHDLFFHRHLLARQSSSSTTVSVPEYNFSMPIDHFDSSDTRTFNNRFWVNDTHYQPGGPVILFDFGEGGVTSDNVAVVVGGAYGSISAPLEVAKALNGVVIGWEHRFYGTSQPFALNQARNSSGGYNVFTAGVPVGGAADYKYHTMEQALEDAAYFAKHFNQTALGTENTVIGGKEGTKNLGPYQTPWIWIGGSYPGCRAAWARQRNPEVWYASWASSAPVQPVEDGSAYFNPIYRGLPKNCSADIQAAANYVDKVFTGSDAAAKQAVNVSSAIATGSKLESQTPYSITSTLFNRYQKTQAQGISKTAQIFCDYMEAFDADEYVKTATSSHISNITIREASFFNNSGSATPKDKGVFASFKSSSSSDISSDEVGFAAFLYGVYKFNSNPVDNSPSFAPSDDVNTDIFDTTNKHSWLWQVLTEFGNVQDFNSSSPTRLGAKFYDYEVARESFEYYYFSSLKEGDIPQSPNQDFMKSMKGWDMAPSNVMFTNGEFDPWRAFGVMSEEQVDLAAPVRAVTQDVPKCNQSPKGTDVFGLLYKGAVHAEDMGYFPGQPSSNPKNPPIYQGSKLFISALQEWVQCFNASRTEDNSGAPSSTPSDSPSSTTSGTAQSSTKAGAGVKIQSVMGLWEVAALIVMYSVYNSAW